MQNEGDSFEKVNGDKKPLKHLFEQTVIHGSGISKPGLHGGKIRGRFYRMNMQAKQRKYDWLQL
jgi:hypothetical protein